MRRPGEDADGLPVHAHVRDGGAQVADLQHDPPVQWGERDRLAERGPAGEEGQALRGQVQGQAIGAVPRPDPDPHKVRHTRHAEVRGVAIEDLAGVAAFPPHPAPGHAEVTEQVHGLQLRIPGERPPEHHLVPASLHGSADVHLSERDIHPPASIGAGDRLPVDGDVETVG